MPNHVSNELRVSLGPGAKRVLLDMFKIQANKLDPAHHGDDDQRSTRPDHVKGYGLSFWNFVRPDALDHDRYHATATGDAMADPLNWYNWNVANWGTKWDAYDVHGTLVHSTSTNTNHLRYRFNTAWSPPVPVVEAMMRMFPELQFSLRYEDESGWGGSLSGLGDIWTRDEEYDAATTHAEATEKRRLTTCDCLVTGGDYAPFKDCPVRSGAE